jgi:hypothetical protein
LQASLQIEREIFRDTTVSIGTMWNHGVHLLSGSAYDLNLNPLQGTTTYIVCPPSATTAPCSGQTITLPNMDNGLLTEGRINPNFDEINELISPGQNHYNSFFVQLQHRMSQGISVQFSYTFAKSMMLDGMDFNNQFDFSNTHAPSLLDQRHRISFAAVYRPGLERLTSSDTGRALLSGWRLSSVMEFSSGRPYAGLLSPACTSPNLSFKQLRSHCQWRPPWQRQPERHRLQRRHREYCGGHQWRWPHAGNRPEFFLRPVAGEDRRWVGTQFCDPGGQGTAISSASVQFVQPRQLLRAERRRDQPVAIQPNRDQLRWRLIAEPALLLGAQLGPEQFRSPGGN